LIIDGKSPSASDVEIRVISEAFANGRTSRSAAASTTSSSSSSRLF
jgi:hypothetical protein